MEVWLVSKGKIRNIIYGWCQLGIVYIRLEEQGSAEFVLRVNVVLATAFAVLQVIMFILH